MIENKSLIFMLYFFQHGIKDVHASFLNCSKSAIWANLSQESSCKVPGYDLFFDGSKRKLRECENKREGGEAIRKLQDIVLDFNTNPAHFGCPLPCEKVSYSFTLNTIHVNSILFEIPLNFTEKHFYMLIVYFKTFTVEKRVETLVYDFGGFLAAAGGNLGLCLGLSCLSVLFTFTKWTKALLQWVQHSLRLQN